MGRESGRFVRFVVNGKAAADPGLRAAVDASRADGHRVEVRVTWERGDASRFAREAVGDGAEVIAVAGGDGTVNEVVNGVMDAGRDNGPAVAVVPYGTANDFATACGVPLADPDAALTLATGGRPSWIDVGRVNGKLFLNVASGGLGAEITATTPPELKRLIGGAAYALMGLISAHQLSAYQATVTAGAHRAEGDLLMLSMGNSRLAGGGHPVAPRAMLDDGLLDLLAVHDATPRDFPAMLEELLDLDFNDRRFVHYVQVASAEFHFDREFQLNLDGEPIRAKHFEFDVLPRALSFVLPAGCDLVGAAA